MPFVHANGLDIGYDVVGAGPPAVVLHGATSVGREDFAAQLPLFSKAFLVHLPDAWCAGERVVLEAALCGCKVIANERVGHTSWGWDMTDIDALRDRLADAPYEFWRLVGGLIAKRAAA